jgi:hypothetical protein
MMIAVINDAIRAKDSPRAEPDPTRRVPGLG